VIERVTAGERLTVTRAGKPVAELQPVAHAALSAATLLRRWRRLPPLDAAALRADIDSALDPRL
jgi:prevent-host-death family protein